MMDFRNRDESDRSQTVHRTRCSRSRPGRRRQTVLPVERLEDRTLLSFTPIVQPGDTLPSGNVYDTTGTNLIPIATADGSTFNSVSDGTETVSFDQTMTAATSPTSDWYSQWGTACPLSSRPTRS